VWLVHERISHEVEETPAAEASISVARLRLDELNIQRNRYLVSDEDSASFKRCVPG